MYRHSKLFAVISYITWIGWIAALLLRDPADPLVRRHLNQALVLNIASTLVEILSRLGGIFYTITNLCALAIFIFSIMGLVRAFRMDDRPLPLVGEFDIIH